MPEAGRDGGPAGCPGELPRAVWAGTTRRQPPARRLTSAGPLITGAAADLVISHPERPGSAAAGHRSAAIFCRPTSVAAHSPTYGKSGGD